MPAQRLSGIVSHLVPSLGSSGVKLPTFDELPAYKNFTGCAWGVWGSDDELGTVNLLTEEVVKRAANEEIRIGKTVSLNWPINFPEKPVFNRRPPEIKMIRKQEAGITRDDEIHMNTQSGSQWDGMRHFGILEHGVFYNNVAAKSVPQGVISIPNPNEIDPALAKIGIQNWAKHGICGRGVLLDLVRYFTDNGNRPLPYDPWTTHSITVNELETVAKHQGVEFRTGDILILRVGFIQKYYRVNREERDALSMRPETFAGIEQSEDMKKFLWNNHFAAIASDQPALEAWPPSPGTHMHQTILGMWGMPLGEFFDLEKLSEICAETGSHVTKNEARLNINQRIGGSASPPNAAAYF